LLQLSNKINFKGEGCGKKMGPYPPPTTPPPGCLYLFNLYLSPIIKKCTARKFKKIPHKVAFMFPVYISEET
jgi:hypothetical protein